MKKYVSDKVLTLTNSKGKKIILAGPLASQIDQKKKKKEFHLGVEMELLEFRDTAVSYKLNL